MDLTIYNKKTYYFLVLLFFLLCMMSWFDVSSSNQAGLKNANRSIAHIFIASVVGLHGIYVAFNRHRNYYGSVINTLLVCILFWFISVDFFNGIPLSISGPMLLLAIWWILTYNFSYSFCRQNKGHIEGLVIVYISMFVVWVLLNLYARTQIILNLGRDNAVTGYAYYLLIFLPYLLLLRDSWKKKTMLFICVIMIMTSFKRGTMVTLPAMLLVYGYMKGVLEKRLSKYAGYACALSIVALLMLPVIDQNSGGFLSKRFSKEQIVSGSGRTAQREKAMRVVNERGFAEYLVGAGHGASVRLLGTGVHNEWVEFVFSFGLVGAMLYLCLGLHFLYQCYFFFKHRSRYAPHMSMMMVYYYMVSLFSGFIGMYITYYFFAFMGIIIFLNEKEIEQQYIE